LKDNLQKSRKNEQKAKHIGKMACHQEACSNVNDKITTKQTLIWTSPIL